MNSATNLHAKRIAVWWVLLAAPGTLLAVGAALIHLPIREARRVRLDRAAA